MAIFKCKMCGGNLDITEGVTIAECDYCGTKQTVPSADNEKKLALFGRANKLRFACEFDKASGIYESIVADFPDEAEAYWGLVLCKYGIEYVDDPATGKKIPTCHRSSFDSVLDDSNFEQVMENADSYSRGLYRSEAKQIEELRKGIIEVSNKEEPYDIFICYKETAENGERTLDSVLAQDIYTALVAKGYKVFFSRITLEDKLGQAYEPYIFAALNSAKIMLAFGTCYDYYNAVWVKNEWSRFLQLIAKGEKKVLIPCYKNIDAYDMPKEFAKLQAQDLGKVGSDQDLLRGIEKIIPLEKKVEPGVVKETVVVQKNENTATVDSLLKRVFMYLEDGDWNNANSYCERVLDIQPENAQAYLGKLMVGMKARKTSDLVNPKEPFDNLPNYQKAHRYADDKLKKQLEEYNKIIADRNRMAEMEKIYKAATDEFDSAKKVKPGQIVNPAPLESRCLGAINQYKKIPNYKDSAKLIAECEELIYNHGKIVMKEAKSKDKFDAAINIFQSLPGNYKDVAALIEECKNKGIEADRQFTYYCALNRMRKAEHEDAVEEAMELFKTIPDYLDSREKIKECSELYDKIRNERLNRLAQEQEELEEYRKRKKRRRIVTRFFSLLGAIAFIAVYTFAEFYFIGSIEGTQDNVLGVLGGQIVTGLLAMIIFRLIYRPSIWTKGMVFSSIAVDIINIVFMSWYQIRWNIFPEDGMASVIAESIGFLGVPLAGVTVFMCIKAAKAYEKFY